MRMRCSVAMLVLVMVASATTAFAQNWSFDARSIALGGVGGSGNLATKMIDEQREYTAIVLPFGLIKVINDRTIFDPNSREFDPVRALEYAASPLHYVIGRGTANPGEAALASDIRNATLSRDLNKYRGFVPANSLVAEGLASINFGGTIKVRKSPEGPFQGVYIGAGPYVSMRTSATIDQGLTTLLASSVPMVVPNARFPLASGSEGQVALAVTGGYRGRFALPLGLGATAERDGIYVAANYNYLHGFRYENIDMAIRLDTDGSGLVSTDPSTTPMVILRNEATGGHGFAIDLGIGAVIDRWEVGFGANGVANRIDWQNVEQTRYSLDSLMSGNSDFAQTTGVLVGDRRVELPVDYRANLGYYADLWSAAAEVGHGFGGASLHAGLERRFDRLEVRGGAMYSTTKWDPTVGIGYDVSRHVSLDLAAFGSHANIERKRQMAVAASVRFNRQK
jgi:hypothetical protein